MAYIILTSEVLKKVPQRWREKQSQETSDNSVYIMIEVVAKSNIICGVVTENTMPQFIYSFRRSRV